MSLRLFHRRIRSDHAPGAQEDSNGHAVPLRRLPGEAAEEAMARRLPLPLSEGATPGRPLLPVGRLRLLARTSVGDYAKIPVR